MTLSSQSRRIGAALVLTLSALAVGYLLGNSGTVVPNSTPRSVEVTAPPKDSVRVLYSLDQKQNDKELIALIDAAKTHVYFAMYTFTLQDVADALVRAKARGVDVRGVLDSSQSTTAYEAPIIATLKEGGVPIETEKHADGNGIMHIKALVTESAYAIGSYNWTNSATKSNDEILEIGTDPAMVKIYETLLLRLLSTYAGNTVAAQGAATTVLGGTYNYTEAIHHIGEYISVRGTLERAYTSKSGTVFLDFCQSYKDCPFTSVIFADDAKKFGDLSRFEGTVVTLTGKVTSYQGRAEIKLSNPNQIR